MIYALDNLTSAATQPAALAPGELTDEQLMSAVKGGDESALATLYRRHTPLLRTIVCRVVNNDTDTDDLIQEVFCEVWRQAAHYAEEKGKALGWLVTLARRRAIDKLRKKQAYQRAGERLIAEAQEQTALQNHGGADENPASSDRAQILERVISTLPIAQQDALKFAFYRGMSQREIAAHTGIPLGTVKTRLELAVKKVRTAILAMGGKSEWQQC